jgi:hypothetical protein
MKKIIALLTVLSFMTMTVFAESFTFASEAEPFMGSRAAVSVADPLFADIAALQLANSEAEAIEGEGVLVVVAVAIVAVAVYAGLRGYSINFFNSGRR